MSAADDAVRPPGLAAPEEQRALNDQWRALRRSATIVAVLCAPAAFLWLWKVQDVAFGWALLATALAVFAFRGLLDLVFWRFIPRPSMFALDDERTREEDVLNRRRHWFWRSIYRVVLLIAIVITIVFLVQLILGDDVTWWGTASSIWTGFWNGLSNPSTWAQFVILPIFFLFNFLILMGPMMMMGISLIKGFEPGDANWGVKLEDVRGQAEAKEEVRRIVNLWTSGEAFERAGGRRERGILFHGAPGTGKTMLAKAIATGFNSPFVTIPGSGFAQTFIGLDSILVRYLARKAKRLARKWGGQCIVFIDEIDAVGMRRNSLGGGNVIGGFEEPTFEQATDLVLETRAWREKQFELRAPDRPGPSRFVRFANKAVPGPGGMFGGGSGQMALNQLLVVMDGLDSPPLGKRMLTNGVNTLLDALYFVPPRIKGRSLRL